MNEQVTVSQLTSGVTFLGTLLARSVEQRTGKNNKPYLDLMLGDKTGEINAKIWDLNIFKEQPAAGNAYQVDGKVEVFNGRYQMRINHIQADPEADIRLLIPAAPETALAMRNRIRSVIASFRSEELQRLVREMLNMTGESLNYYPAAQRMHHAELGGLLHHTTSMLQMGERLCDVYPFLDRDLLMAGIILHDLAKTLELKSDRFGNVSDYTADGILIGHLVRGVVMLEQAAERTQVRSELVLLLQHMIISHHGVPEYGSPRLPMTPEAEALHWIDTLDAKMNEMESIQERTPAGAFSERIGYLDDRRMYHPTWRGDAAGDAKAPTDPNEPDSETDTPVS